MKAPSFLHGVGIAFVLSFFGSALFVALTTVLSAGFVARLVIALLGLAYLAYLLRRCRQRTGRIVVLALWVLVAAVTWFAGLPLPLYLIIHVGMLWLIRSLYFYSGVLPALVDLGLSGLALAAAVWAATWSSSLFLAIWCFFLVQALFVAIPPAITRKARRKSTDFGDDEPFQRAHRTAEAALRRLSAHS